MAMKRHIMRASMVRRHGGTSELPPELWTITRRDIERVKTKIAGLCDLRPGKVSVQYNTCGTEGCCRKADPSQRHGPYCQLNYSRGGRSRTETVRPEHLGEVEAEIATYCEFQSPRRVDRHLDRARPAPSRQAGTCEHLTVTTAWLHLKRNFQLSGWEDRLLETPDRPQRLVPPSVRPTSFACSRWLVSCGVFRRLTFRWAAAESELATRAVRISELPKLDSDGFDHARERRGQVFLAPQGSSGPSHAPSAGC